MCAARPAPRESLSDHEPDVERATGSSEVVGKPTNRHECSRRWDVDGRASSRQHFAFPCLHFQSHSKSRVLVDIGLGRGSLLVGSAGVQRALEQVNIAKSLFGERTLGSTAASATRALSASACCARCSLAAVATASISLCAAVAPSICCCAARDAWSAATRRSSRPWRATVSVTAGSDPVARAASSADSKAASASLLGWLRPKYERHYC